MILVNKNEKRRTIPRWRSFESTRSTGELIHHRNNKPLNVNEFDDFRNIKAEWDNDNNIITATELLSYSFVTSNFDEGLGAAEYLLKIKEGNVPDAVIDLAKRVAYKDEANIDVVNNGVGLLLPDTVGKQIHLLKHQTRCNF